MTSTPPSTHYEALPFVMEICLNVRQEPKCPHFLFFNYLSLLRHLCITQPLQSDSLAPCDQNPVSHSPLFLVNHHGGMLKALSSEKLNFQVFFDRSSAISKSGEHWEQTTTPKGKQRKSLHPCKINHSQET
ncbi:hypothetical protein V6N12_017313 [Hibiscus sabdariffa]|uniref:Uncharacterized protein n=1 Tax=Hibiscus sabdariffa TaxID=183260 RepID=A0ABR2CF45_9ROSI